MRYLEQDKREELQRAKDSGRSDEYLAGKVGMPVAELQSLMGWKSSKPAQQQSEEFDLFACERLDAVL